jgi:hypothetical protein
MVVEFGFTIVIESFGLETPIVGAQLYVFPPMAKIVVELPEQMPLLGETVGSIFGCTII